MNIDNVSDIHINHWVPFITNQLKWEQRTRAFVKRLLRNGTGEVLVLAGDFGESNIQTIWLLDEASKHYEMVYWTFGNHDLYLLSKNDTKRYVNHSLNRVDEVIQKTSHLKNVVPLIKNVHEFKGKRFAGDALWYLPKTMADWEFYRNVSNDSAYILLNEAWNMEDVARLLYKSSADWYDTLEKEDIDVMVTHIPPVHPPISPYEPNGCYHTTVPFLAAPHWVCGHVHLQGEFQKAGTHFHLNCIGYPQSYSNARAFELPGDNVDETLTIDIKTFRI